MIVHQFGQRDVEQVLFDLANLQQEDVLVAIIGDHFVVNFRSNPGSEREKQEISIRKQCAIMYGTEDSLIHTFLCVC